MATERLTEARVRAAAKGGKRTSITDSVEAGLELRVDKKGAAFALRRSVEGRDVRITLGRVPDLTLGEAREMALHLKAKMVKERSTESFQNRKEAWFFSAGRLLGQAEALLSPASKALLEFPKRRPPYKSKSPGGVP